MPNVKSAEKRMRTNKIREQRNKQKRSRLRTAIKKVRQSDSAETAAEAFETAKSLLDRAASRRLIHPNKAARLKSQLARAIQAKAETGLSDPRSEGRSPRRLPGVGGGSFIRVLTPGPSGQLHPADAAVPRRDVVGVAALRGTSSPSRGACRAPPPLPPPARRRPPRRRPPRRPPRTPPPAAGPSARRGGDRAVELLQEGEVLVHPRRGLRASVRRAALAAAPRRSAARRPARGCRLLPGGLDRPAPPRHPGPRANLGPGSRGASPPASICARTSSQPLDLGSDLLALLGGRRDRRPPAPPRRASHSSSGISPMRWRSRASWSASRALGVPRLARRRSARARPAARPAAPPGARASSSTTPCSRCW